MKAAHHSGRGCCCIFTNKSGSLSHQGRERTQSKGICCELCLRARWSSPSSPSTCSAQPCSLPAAINPPAPAGKLIRGRGKYFLCLTVWVVFFFLILAVMSKGPEVLAVLSAGSFRRVYRCVRQPNTETSEAVSLFKFSRPFWLQIHVHI